MTARRTLSALLTELAGSIRDLPAAAGLRVSSLAVALPVEIELDHAAGDIEFRAELPRFITRTSFDGPPDRLTVRWMEGPLP